MLARLPMWLKRQFIGCLNNRRASHVAFGGRSPIPQSTASMCKFVTAQRSKYSRFVIVWLVRNEAFLSLISVSAANGPESVSRTAICWREPPSMNHPAT